MALDGGHFVSDASFRSMRIFFEDDTRNETIHYLPIIRALNKIPLNSSLNFEKISPYTTEFHECTAVYRKFLRGLHIRHFSNTHICFMASQKIKSTWKQILRWLENVAGLTDLCTTLSHGRPFHQSRKWRRESALEELSSKVLSPLAAECNNLYICTICTFASLQWHLVKILHFFKIVTIVQENIRKQTKEMNKMKE